MVVRRGGFSDVLVAVQDGLGNSEQIAEKFGCEHQEVVGQFSLRVSKALDEPNTWWLMRTHASGSVWQQ